MSRNRTIARPYARAVFELAHSEQSLAKWSGMLALASGIAADPHLLALMRNPNFSLDERTELFLGVGEDVFTPQMQTFIRLLGRFKRLQLLPEIAVMYEEMKARAEQIIVVELTSAFALDDIEQREFSDKLKKRMHCNIVLECVTDKSIIGGAIIRAGDMVIDGSIRGRLNKLADSVGILN